MKSRLLSTSLALLFLLPVTLHAATFYVATDGNDSTGNGTLGNPFLTIQKGLDTANNGDTVIVRPGTYSGEGNINLDMTEFSGQVKTLQSEGGPGVTIIDCQGAGRAIAFVDFETPATVFSGFTIRNGAVGGAFGTPAFGGGIACFSASPTISNCVIEYCTAAGSDFLSLFAPAQGGGIYMESSSPVITDCIIRFNSAVAADNTDDFVSPAYPAQGGGIFCDSSSPQIINCQITTNSVTGGDSTAGFLPATAGLGSGGGVCILNSFNVSITNSIIADNTCQGGLHTNGGDHADGRGGGLYSADSIVTITNTTLRNNSATGANRLGQGICMESSSLNLRESVVHGNGTSVTSALGGGLYSVGSTGSLRNVTLSGNRAFKGGGVHAVSGTITLLNCTVASNTVEAGGSGGIFNAGATLNLKNTIIASHGAGGNLAGTITSQGNNLSSDSSVPLAGPGDLNNTNPLLGALQNNGGPTLTHALGGGSPAIDAGNNTGAPTTDQRGQPRPADGDGNGSAVTDIGAFEAPTAGGPTATPTPSPTLSPTSTPSATPTRSPTASPSASPSGTPTPSPTASPSPSPTESPNPSVTQSPSPTPSPTPFNDALLVSETIPAQAASLNAFQFSIRLQNTGDTPWSSETGYSLGVTLDACGMLPSPMISLPGGVSIQPGDVHEFVGILNAPSAPQICHLEYRMRQSGTFFGPTVGQDVEIIEAIQNAQFVSNTIPASIPPSDNRVVGILVRNTGNTQWGPIQGTKLTVLLDLCGLISEPAIALNELVGPNQQHQFLVTLRAPAAEGPCDLSLEMEDGLANLFGPVFMATVDIAPPPNASRDWSAYE